MFGKLYFCTLLPIHFYILQVETQKSTLSKFNRCNESVNVHCVARPIKKQGYDSKAAALVSRIEYNK